MSFYADFIHTAHVHSAGWQGQPALNKINTDNLTDLVIAEMRTSFEKEKLRAVSEARRLAQIELETAVKLTKMKQW